MIIATNSSIEALSRLNSLLRRSTIEQALSILLGSQKFADLSVSQYREAAELVLQAASTAPFPISFPTVSQFDWEQLLESLALLLNRPWLAVFDAEHATEAELPFEMLDLSIAFGITEGRGLEVFRRIQGRKDLAQTARVGAAAEKSLLELLDSLPQSHVKHISPLHDGYGYDLEWCQGGRTSFVEVKAIRPGPTFHLYLSRHEFLAAKSLAGWRLFLVPQDSCTTHSILEVSAENVFARLPIDKSNNGRWESAKLWFSSADATHPLIDFRDGSY